MKKTNLLLSLAIICCAVLFTACGGFSDYTKVIPNDPVAVAKVNVGNLLEKSDILADKQFSGTVTDGIEETCDTEARKLLKEILKNPNKSGIDFNQPAYLIVENVERAKGFALAAVKSDNDLYSLIETLLNDEELKIRGFYLEKKDGMFTIEDKKGNAWAAFDGSKFIFAFTDNSRPDATEYMKPAENSGSKSEGLKNFLSSNDDLGVWVNYHQVARFMIPALRKEINLQGVISVSDFEGTELIYSLNFENGRAVGKYQFLGDNKFINASKEMTQNTTGELLKYIPKNSFGAAQVGVKNLANIFDFLPTDIRSELDRGLNELNKELAQTSNPFEVSYSLLNSLDGDIVVGMTPMIPEAEQNEPQFIVIADCKDSDLFDTIVKSIKLSSHELNEIGTDVYALNLNKRVDWEASTYNYDRYEYDYVYVRRGYDYYFGYRDGKMFIIPENFYKNNLKPLSPNFSENPLASELKGICNAVVDIHEILDCVESMEYGSRSDRAIFNQCRIFKSANFKVNDNYSCEFEVTFSDKDTNALKQLKDFIVEIAIGENL